MVQENRAVEKEDQVEEKEDRAVEEDPVQGREITPGIIYINRRRLETQESGQVYKITGPET